MSKPGIVAATGKRIIVPVSVGGTDPDLNLSTEEELGTGTVAATGERIKVPVSLGGIDPEIYQDPHVPTAIPPESPGFLDRIADMITGKSRLTGETEGLPEFGSVLRWGSPYSTKTIKGDLYTVAGLMFASGDEAKKDVIKEHFPDVKMHDDEHGTTIIEFPDGKTTVLNKPGPSFQDAAQLLGEIVLFYGPSKLAGFAKGLWKKAAIGGAGAAATQAAIEKGGQFLGSKQPVSPATVTAAGALGVVGEVVPGVIKQTIAGRRAKKLGTIVDDTDDAVAGFIEGQKVSEKSKIPLYRAQKTLDSADLKRQTYIASLPAASKEAAKKLELQNKAAYDEVISIMDQIAPAGKVSYAAERVRNAAELAIKAKRTIRKEAASPLYDEAYKDRKFYSTAKTRKVIDDKLKEYGYHPTSPVARILRRVRKSFVASSKEGKPISRGLRIREMHLSKKGIDDMLASPKIENSIKKDLMDIKKVLLKEIDDYSPAYKKARIAFIKKSPAVNMLEESIIGRMSKLDETQLNKMASMIYDPKEYATNPTTIKMIKRVVEEQDPQAWRDITRTHLENRLGVELDTGVEEVVENIPGQLYRQWFGNVPKRKVMYAGLDKETADNMKYLQQGLKRASLGRPGGSPTAIHQVIERELRGIGGTIRNIFKAPITTGAEIGEDYAYNQKVRALGKVLFDEKWQPSMRELRRLNPNSPKAGKFFTKLFKRVLKETGKPALQVIKPALPIAQPYEE